MTDKKRCKYICLEGCEGVGKTTQTQKLVDFLRAKGYKVLQTKEPGTSHAPLTLQLRAIMLDNKYDKELTAPARELISQAIRSIHLEKVIVPAITEYDYIIQDRGILSGLAYGFACGNGIDTLSMLSAYVTDSARHVLCDGIYDSIIYLRGDTSAGLKKALAAKQEFETGDAMESRGTSFLEQASSAMDELSSSFNTKKISVDGKSIDAVFSEILKTLNIKEE
jgi:dTMP kinase